MLRHFQDQDPTGSVVTGFLDLQRVFTKTDLRGMIHMSMCEWVILTFGIGPVNSLRLQSDPVVKVTSSKSFVFNHWWAEIVPLGVWQHHRTDPSRDSEILFGTPQVSLEEKSGVGIWREVICCSSCLILTVDCDFANSTKSVASCPPSTSLRPLRRLPDTTREISV